MADDEVSPAEMLRAQSPTTHWRYDWNLRSPQLCHPKGRRCPEPEKHRLKEPVIAMMEGFDTNAAARGLMLDHGDQAVVAAVLMADDEMDRGNANGFRRWLEVARLIRSLQGD